MSFARNYERKIDKMAENAIFSVSLFLCTKSRHTMINMSIFHACLKKKHQFSCVLVYIWIRKNQTVCSQATIKFVYFFQIFVSKGNTALDKNASCFWSFNPHAKQTYIRADWSTSLHTALVSNVMRTLQRCISAGWSACLFFVTPPSQKAANGKGGSVCFEF